MLRTRASTGLTDRLKRLAVGSSTEADRRAVQAALAARRIALATGEQAVAIGGDATDAVITTGSGNLITVFKGAQADVIRGELDRLRPTWWQWSAAGVLAAVLLFAAVIGIYRQLNPPSDRPDQMDGNLNVAVAGFDGPKEWRGRLHSLSNRVFESLNGTLDPRTFDVWAPDWTGRLTGGDGDTRAQQAAKQAERIGAHVIIYGHAEPYRGGIRLTPEFHISRSKLTLTDPGELQTGAEEIAGAYPAGEPIDLRGNPENSAVFDALQTALQDRAVLLLTFIRGLDAYEVGNFDSALRFFDEAEQRGWTDPKGKALLYLFRGAALAKRGAPEDLRRAEEAYRAAIAVSDGEHARSTIGLGNLYLKRGTEGKFHDSYYIDKAIEQYEHALAAETKPPTAYVEVKALYNLGLARSFKARFPDSPCLDDAAVTALQRAAAAYQQQAGVPLVDEIGAKIYYQLGVLYEDCGERRRRDGKRADATQLHAQAAEMYRRSSEIAEPKTVRRRGWLGLPFRAPPPETQEENWHVLRWWAQHRLAYTYMARADLGDSALYEPAVGIYTRITELYAGGDGRFRGLAAEAYYHLGLIHERRGEATAALDAYERAQQASNEGSWLHQQVERRLQQLQLRQGKGSGP